MNVTIELPKRVEVSDYHEFDDMRDYLKKLNKSIKVIEIGHAKNYHDGAMYQGMIYVGRLESKENVPLYKKIYEKCKEE